MTERDGSAAKAALRADARARRDALPEYARREGSERIAERAIALAREIKPGVVAAYRAIRTEVVPDAIAGWALGEGMVLVLPAIGPDGNMAFRRFREGDVLLAGPFGTAAPARTAPEIEPDLVIVPMMAFDRAGTRLGHGRGYYDRAIWKLHARGVRPALVGVAFSVQEVGAIPAEPHDARMDWIVTERETLDLRHLG